MSSDLISQDVVPIGTGYVILMGVLAAGLRLRRRDEINARAQEEAGTAQSTDTEVEEPGSGGKKASAVARLAPPGWPRFLVQVCGTALGGFVLLMAVDVIYYYGVARVAGQFIESGVTGGLLLIGISLPLFVLASWLYLRWRGH